MGRYRTINVHLNRDYRNDLNWNFEQLEKDILNCEALGSAVKAELLAEIKRVEQESIERDNFIAGENIDQIIQRINAAIMAANQAAADTTLKGNTAEAQGNQAKVDGDYAKTQGDYAKLKGEYADEKAQSASNAAALAEQEASNLGQLKIDVVSATQAANTSATNADGKAAEAETQAAYAQAQGTYAKEQGDYAKQIAQDITEGLVTSVNGKTGAVSVTPENIGAATPQDVSTLDNKVTDIQDDVARIALQATDNWKNLKSRGVNVKVPPSPLVAAKGDGTTDDTSVIQAAIDYASTNSINSVYLPSGTYKITSSLLLKDNISLIGDGYMHTILKWFIDEGGTILNTTDVNLWNVKISNMQFTKDFTVTGQVTGIKGGSSIAKYNSANAVFSDLKFLNLRAGIVGNGDTTGVGIFDSYFERCWFSSCFNGLNTYGSGNKTISCRFTYNVGAGLVLGYLNNESFAGNIDIGSVFVENAADVTIPDSSGIRPCSFHGTWFEKSTNGILVIPNISTRVMSMTFDNCMLSTSYTENAMSFYGAEGNISVRNCVIYQTESTHGKTIVSPETNGTLKVDNCIGYNYDGSVFKPPSGNLFSGVPPAYWGANGDFAIDISNNKLYFKTGDAWTKYTTLS